MTSSDDRNELSMSTKRTTPCMRRLAFQILFPAAAVFTLLFSDATAQTQFRSMALSAAGNAALALDGDGVFLNPSNLVLPDNRSRIVIQLGSAGVMAGGSLLQFQYYNRYFVDGRHLSSAEAEAMLNDWFGSRERNAMRSAGVFADLVPLAVTYRADSYALGLAARYRGYGQLRINRGLLDLAFVGTQAERTIPIDADLHGYAATDISLAYAHRFEARGLSAGIAPKFILGHSYADFTFRSALDVTPDALTHRFRYHARSAGAGTGLIKGINLFSSSPFSGDNIGGGMNSVSGTGFGVDMGVNYELNARIRIAGSITDLGYIRWTNDPQTTRSADSLFAFNGFELNFDHIDAEFGGDAGAYFTHFVDSLAQASYGSVVKDRQAFSSTLPTAVHVGGSWIPGIERATLTAGASLALRTTAGNLSRTPILHLGGEYRLGSGSFSVPLRTGLRLGGYSAAVLGLSTGVQTKFYDLSLGITLSPRTNMLGHGAHYAAGLSVLTVRLP